MKKSNSKRHPVWRSVVLAFAGLVLGMNVYVWNARSVVGDAMAMPFGYGATVVCSEAMEPTLAVNDLVVFHRTDQVNTGDILAYQQGRELVISRVSAVDGDTLYTRRDGQDSADETVDMTAVKGVLVGRIPHAGKIIRALQTPKGVIVVLLVALILTEVDFRRQRARDRAQLEAVKTDIRRLRHEQK